MKANFLLYPDSFLNILSPDGFKNLRILDATISDAKQKGDTIYGNPLFAQLILSNGTQLLDLMNSAVQRPIGFTNDHFKMLVKYFWNKSPNASIDWISLNQEPELKNQNNGMMGLPVNTKPCPDEKYVYNIPSWYEFHCKFLTANNQYIDWPKEADPEKENANNKKTMHIHKKFFANTNYSNQLLISEAINLIEKKEKRKLTDEEKNRITEKDFEREVRLVPSNEIISYATRVGKLIAERNYYIFDQDLSNAEQNETHQLRQIYSIKKNNQFIYLSIDFASAAFEVCDHNGNHLGEWLFTGLNNGPAENEGEKDHGLKSLKKGIFKK